MGVVFFYVIVVVVLNFKLICVYNYNFTSKLNRVSYFAHKNNNLY